MKAIRDKIKKLRYPYYVYREIMKKKEERSVLWKDAVRQFDKGTAKHGSLREYKRALYRHRFLYEEYNAYKLWDLDKKRWGEYISDREMQCIYRKVVQINVANCFSDKLDGLEVFAKFVHRRWMNPDAMGFEVFKDLVMSTDCIAKPRRGMKGQGVFFIRKDGDENRIKELYQYCRKNHFIVEERLRASEEIEEFHPQSLNTVRVVTISNKNKVEILDAEFRMGIGENVVDNASCGGILASINVVTGALIENGVDMFGNEYVNHPSTGKAIKGFMIPHWDEIVRVCKEAATVVQGTVFVGWDVCVRQNGEIELIEANAFPGVIGLQTARKQGLKPRLQTKGKEILGYNPLNLISVWSKSYVRFLGKYGYYN